MEKVRCPACLFGNPDSLRQCVKCGGPLPKRSPGRRLLQQLLPALFRPAAAPVPPTDVTSIGQLPKHITTQDGITYSLGEKLGRGGFCDVYCVRRTDDDRAFALKLLRMWEIPTASREDLETRFLLEYGLGRQANEYLVQTYERGDYQGNPFFVMDYCEGGSLAARVGQDWPDHRLKAISVDILRALEQLHQAGVIHRDLKPSNVVFCQNRPKLIDFGISGRLDLRLTKAHETLGTDVYMAPELFRQESKSYQSKLPTIDIYSFGVMLFELLSKGNFPHGDPPNAADRNHYHEHLSQYARRVRAEQWPELDRLREQGLAPFWNDLIADCLRADPTRRIQSVRALLDRLGEVEPLLYCPRCGHEQPSRRVARCRRCGNALLHGTVGLRVMVGREAGNFHNLSELTAGRGLATLGRYSDFELSDTNIEIQEFNEHQPYISRYHATIERSEQTGEWFIRDGQWRPAPDGTFAWLPSRNGVFVNAARADPNGLPIYPGDIITLGEITLKVELQT